jgi:hypothetical protein
MRFHFRSKRNQDPRRERRSWLARPALELLEDRVTPSVGLFNEDFSDDLIPIQPGYDSAADGLLFVHQPSHAFLQSSGSAPSPPHYCC